MRHIEGSFCTCEACMEAHEQWWQDNPLAQQMEQQFLARVVLLGGTYKPIVLMEDAPIHTDDHPFCDDPTCACRYDEQLLQEYVYSPMERGELTKAEAARLRWGKQV